MAAARVSTCMLVASFATVFGLLIHTTAGLSTAVDVCGKDNFPAGDPRIECMQGHVEEMVEACGSPTKFCRTGGYKICSDGSTTIYGSASSSLAGCLEFAKESLLNTCPYATGAQVTVDSGVCHLRYEIYPYLD